MAEAFVFNMDSLVTRDYLEACLDARFSEFERKLDAKFDQRFDQIDRRFEKVDARFAQIDVRFAETDGKFRLVHWMIGINIASTTLPTLYQFLAS